MNIWHYVNAQRGGIDDGTMLSHLTASAAYSVERGASAVCLTEHHLLGYSTHGDPFVYGAYLASRITPAWLVLSVAAVAAHHPVRLAENMCLLDRLVDGRCIIGMGGGGSLVELRAFGVTSEAHKREAVDAAITVVDHLLAERGCLDSEPFDTGLHRGVLSGSVTPSATRPGGPLRARSISRIEQAVWAGERGWSMLFGRSADTTFVTEAVAAHRQAMLSAGFAPDAVATAAARSAAQRCVFVASTDDRASATAAPGMANLAAASARMYGTGPAAQIEGGSDRTGPLVGSPITVIEELERWTPTGIGALAIQFTWGGLDLAAVNTSQRLFFDAVAPAVADLTGVVAR